MKVLETYCTTVKGAHSNQRKYKSIIKIIEIHVSTKRCFTSKTSVQITCKSKKIDEIMKALQKSSWSAPVCSWGTLGVLLGAPWCSSGANFKKIKRNQRESIEIKETHEKSKKPNANSIKPMKSNHTYANQWES